LGTPKLPVLATGAPINSKPATAEQWVQAAVHNTENPLVELKASVALVAEGRTDQALGRLAAARERGCQSPDLIRFHARLLQAKGRPAAAATVLETLVASPEGTDQDLHECLGAWEKAGQLDRAENLVERLLVKRPSRDLFRWLATRDAAEGRFERALLLLGQLSRRTPFDPADAFQLAEVALRAGRPQLALDAVSMLEESGHRSPRFIRLAERAKASAVAESSRTPNHPAPRGAGS
jgi:tetratricopeptide (TPR) repeat protein